MRLQPALRSIDRSHLHLLESTVWREWDDSPLSRVLTASQQLGRGLSHWLKLSDPQDPMVPVRTIGELAGWDIPGIEPGIHSIAPVDHLLPCPSPLQVFGPDGEGGKKLCEAAALLGAPGCVVYSLGSNNQWEFELSILSRFPHCQVFTFDCTSRPPATPTPGLHFANSCVGARDEVMDGRQFYRLQSLMERRGHAGVSLLKMDVEGAEMEVFGQLLAVPPPQSLPHEVSFEVHFWHAWAFSMLHVALFEQLHYSGYRLVHWENNAVGGPSCNEFTALRVYC